MKISAPGGSVQTDKSSLKLVFQNFFLKNMMIIIHIINFRLERHQNWATCVDRPLLWLNHMCGSTSCSFNLNENLMLHMLWYDFVKLSLRFMGG